MEVAVLTAADVEIEGKKFNLDLAQKAARRLIENAALVEAAASGGDHVENL